MAYKQIKTATTAFALASGLVFAATSSFAFQEETAPVMPKAAGNGAAQKSQAFDPALDLGAGSGVQQKEQGTVIKIPGFGKLGVLPKLDFGLELLYGGDDGKSVENDAFQSNDVFIRGSIKRRF